MRNTVIASIAFSLTWSGCRATHGVSSNPLVYHGSDASPAAYPWMVSLGPRGGLCAGSLIAPAVVLTAKHCNANSVMIGGILRRYAVTETLETIEENDAMHTRRVVASEEWAGGDGFQHGDIRLLYLDAPVDGITPVALNGARDFPKESATKEEADQNRNLIVLGWGGTEKANTSATLQEVNVAAYTQAACAAMRYSMSADEICTGVWGTDIGAFKGDSGGPLIATHQNQLVQIGVASTASLDAAGAETGQRRKGGPANFVRVSSAVSWIQERAKAKGFVVTVIP